MHSPVMRICALSLSSVLPNLKSSWLARDHQAIHRLAETIESFEMIPPLY